MREKIFSFDYMDTECNTTKSKMHEKADMGLLLKISCQCGVPRQRNIIAFYVLQHNSCVTSFSSRLWQLLTFLRKVSIELKLQVLFNRIKGRHLLHCAYWEVIQASIKAISKAMPLALRQAWSCRRVPVPRGMAPSNCCWKENCRTAAWRLSAIAPHFTSCAGLLAGPALLSQCLH